MVLKLRGITYSESLWATVWPSFSKLVYADSKQFFEDARIYQPEAKTWHWARNLLVKMKNKVLLLYQSNGWMKLQMLTAYKSSESFMIAEEVQEMVSHVCVVWLLLIYKYRWIMIHSFTISPRPLSGKVLVLPLHQFIRLLQFQGCFSLSCRKRMESFKTTDDDSAIPNVTFCSWCNLVQAQFGYSIVNR